MILKPGNLLRMARCTFQVKCNSQFREIPSPGVLPAKAADILMGAGLCELYCRPVSAGRT